MLSERGLLLLANTPEPGAQQGADCARLPLLEYTTEGCGTVWKVS